jgi:hypothetical protein
LPPHPNNLDDLLRSVRDAVRDHNAIASLIDDVTRGEMPEYLFRHTHGIVGLLRRL